MENISEETIRKMIQIIKTITEQGNDYPKLVNALFGIAVVNVCKEVYQELNKGV